LTALMVRAAPGFDVDERQLDTRLTHQSVEALRAEHARNQNVLHFCLAYFSAALHGDFGYSLSLNRPIRQLLAERIPLTARLVGYGVAAGWALALALAFAEALLRSAGLRIAVVFTMAGLLCIPTAVLALGFVMLRAPAFLAIALVVLPKVLSVVRHLLARSYGLPHIVTARAKGIGELSVLLRHVLPVVGGPIIALAGVSVSLALGACIPIEALCGLPGVGQLAWLAALGRDLPALMIVTVLVTLLTLAANLLSDLVNESLQLRMLA
jgi:peptide/nickel transport system permease protein